LKKEARCRVPDSSPLQELSRLPPCIVNELRRNRKAPEPGSEPEPATFAEMLPEAVPEVLVASSPIPRVGLIQREAVDARKSKRPGLDAEFVPDQPVRSPRVRAVEVPRELLATVELPTLKCSPPLDFVMPDGLRVEDSPLDSVLDAEFPVMLPGIPAVLVECSFSEPLAG